MYQVVKRAFDLVFSLFLLLTLAPILLLLYVLVRSNMGTPVFFKQQRLGVGGSSFYLYKFRTMSFDIDAHNQLLPDHLRITKLGSFLRSSSMDELPSLLNIFNGSMSFVGPRPLPVKYLPRFNEAQRQRLTLRPGLTGLAQINGRNQTTWSQRFYYDLLYVKRYSLWLDLYILLRTVTVVLLKRGISNSASITMPEFTGDN